VFFWLQSFVKVVQAFMISCSISCKILNTISFLQVELGCDNIVPVCWTVCNFLSVEQFYSSCGCVCSVRVTELYCFTAAQFYGFSVMGWPLLALHYTHAGKWFKTVGIFNCFSKETQGCLKKCQSCKKSRVMQGNKIALM
jgi:hypothetical protein